MLWKFQRHEGNMLMHGRGKYKKNNLKHWSKLSLILETVGSVVSRKTKNVIVGSNVDTRKTLHQNHNDMKHLIKRTGRNKHSNLG